MSVVAQFQTPHGDIIVERQPGTYVPVVWVVKAPGGERHTYGRKRDAVAFAKDMAQSMAKAKRKDLLAAWDKVREYV